MVLCLPCLLCLFCTTAKGVIVGRSHVMIIIAVIRSGFNPASGVMLLVIHLGTMCLSGTCQNCGYKLRIQLHALT